MNPLSINTALIMSILLYTHRRHVSANVIKAYPDKITHQSNWRAKLNSMACFVRDLTFLYIPAISAHRSLYPLCKYVSNLEECWNSIHPTWRFSDRASWIDYILITNMMHWLLFINTILLYVFRASSAHLQEDTVAHMQHMILSLSMRVPGGL